MGKHVSLLGHIILIRSQLVLFLLINKVKHLHQPLYVLCTSYPEVYGTFPHKYSSYLN